MALAREALDNAFIPRVSDAGWILRGKQIIMLCTTDCELMLVVTTVSKRQSLCTRTVGVERVDVALRNTSKTKTGFDWEKE